MRPAGGPGGARSGGPDPGCAPSAAGHPGAPGAFGRPVRVRVVTPYPAAGRIGTGHAPVHFRAHGLSGWRSRSVRAASWAVRSYSARAFEPAGAASAARRAVWAR